MADLERIKTTLEGLDNQLYDANLEPDPARKDWMDLRADLDKIRHLLENSLLPQVTNILNEIQSDDERRDLSLTAARLTGRVGALILASGDENGGISLIRRARALAPEGGTKEMFAEAEAAPGMYLIMERVAWLVHHRKNADARRLAAPLIKDSGRPVMAQTAKVLIDVPQPIKGSPGLATINGIGTTFYGRRDPWPDGTYVTTRYFVVLFIPIMPIDAYRVFRQGDRYMILGRVELGPIARKWRVVVPALIALAVLAGALQSWYFSAESRFSRALEEVRQSETSATDPEAREDLIERYGQLAEAYTDDLGAKVSPAVVAALRLSCAQIERPFGLDQLEKARQVVKYYESLPAIGRNEEAAGLLVKNLDAWASDLPQEDLPSLEARASLLEQAFRFARNTDRKSITEKRDAAKLGVAVRLAEDWPLDAFRIIAGVSSSPEALTRVGELIPALGDSPSVWFEMAPYLTKWSEDVKAAKIEALLPLATSVDTRLEAARQRMDDEARKTLLESGDEAALRKALARYPKDQEIAAALAEQQRIRGDLRGAASTLESVGPPGVLVHEVRLALASIYNDTDRLRDAERLLDRLLASRLPDFETARTRYEENAEALQRRLIDKVQAGNLPAEVSSQLQAAPESEADALIWKWLLEEMRKDTRLDALHTDYMSYYDVVSTAMLLGSVKLRLANQVTGEERAALLKQAENALLTIQSEASEDAGYRIRLGQVYYRTGRVEEGEAEFNAVLEEGDAQDRLDVAHVYRDLGMDSRAKEVATQVFDKEDSPWKENAAVLLALLADTPDEREQWFRKADQESSFVRVNLLELEGERLLDEGKYAEADSKYAKVVEDFRAGGLHDAASSNNAALALQRRFQCTGDLRHLDEAVRLLESAVKQEPDSKLCISNLSSVLAYRGALEVLKQWLDVRTLRPGPADVTTIVDAMLTGSNRTELLDKLRKDRSVQQSLRVARQQEVLAPNQPSSYDDQADWFERLEDTSGLEALGQRLDQVASLDTRDTDEQRKRFQNGEMDDFFRDRAQKALRRLDGLLQKNGQDTDAPTGAAIKLVRASMYSMLLTFDSSVDSAEAMIRELREADQLWPPIGSGPATISALIVSSLLHASRESEEIGALWREKARIFTWNLLLHEVVKKGGEGLDVVRRQPGLAEAEQLALVTPLDRPTLDNWVLARTRGNETLEKVSRSVADRKVVRLKTALDVRLSPNNPSPQARAGLLEEIAALSRD